MRDARNDQPGVPACTALAFSFSLHVCLGCVHVITSWDSVVQFLGCTDAVSFRMTLILLHSSNQLVIADRWLDSWPCPWCRLFPGTNFVSTPNSCLFSSDVRLLRLGCTVQPYASCLRLGCACLMNRMVRSARISASCLRLGCAFTHHVNPHCLFSSDVRLLHVCASAAHA